MTRYIDLNASKDTGGAHVTTDILKKPLIDKYLKPDLQQRQELTSTPINK